jgi:hypothetical protein
MNQRINAFVLIFISLILLACGEQDLHVKSYACTPEGDIPTDYTQHKFTIKNNQVFHVATEFSKNKEVSSRIFQLEDCIVINSQNWQCGGLPYKGLLSGLGNSERFQVVNGKFTRHDGGKIYLTPPKGCDSFYIWKTN